jgi:hypothetical protein
MPCTPNRTPARLISKSFSRNVPSSDLRRRASAKQRQARRAARG